MLSYELETTVGWMFYMKKQKSITKPPKSLHIKVLQNLNWKVNSTKNRIVEFDTPFSKNMSMIDYFRHVFKSSMKALIVKGKKKCLQNRHKRKHCWALDATVKIADARSLRTEGQMFFLVKSRIWILLSGRQKQQPAFTEHTLWAEFLKNSAAIYFADKFGSEKLKVDVFW